MSYQQNQTPQTNYNVAYSPVAGGAQTSQPGIVPPPPSYDELFATQNRFKSESPRFQDVWAYILFVVHFIVIGLILVSSDKVAAKDYDKNDDDGFTLSPEQTNTVYRITMLLCAFGIALGLLWFIVAKAFARALIYFTLLMGVIMSSIFFVMFVAQGEVAGALVMFVVMFINLLCFYFWRHRIPFAVAMLKTSISLTQKYPLFVLALYVAFFGYSIREGNRMVNEDARAWVMGLLLLSFYWSSQVIANVVHVTASGCFATWYFMSNTPSMPTDPTVKSLKRATTWSFGSICFGSLLIAVIQILRQVVNQARRNSDNRSSGAALFLLCILACLLAIFQDLVEYFNKVAIYGTDFITSAKRTWQLTKERGVDAIINDSLIGPVLVMGGVIGGIINAVAGYLLADNNNLPTEWCTIMALVGMIIGAVFVGLMMSVIDSCVATIFVCYAEDPQPLASNNAELYRLINSTYNMRMVSPTVITRRGFAPV